MCFSFDGHDVRGIAKKYGLDVAALMDRLGYRYDNISMLFVNPLPPTTAVHDRIQGNVSWFAYEHFIFIPFFHIFHSFIKSFFNIL